MNDDAPHAAAPVFDPDAEGRDDYYIAIIKADWKNDRALQLCSLAARGLWFELMLICHDTGGYVRINGQAPDLNELAAAVNCTAQEIGPLLAELAKRGVFSLASEDKAIVSRRIWRDAKKREADKLNGKLGGRPKQKFGGVKNNRGFADPQNPYSQNDSYSQNQKETEGGATSAPTSPAVLTFPTRGSVKTWGLTQQHLDSWSEAYPGLDLLAEARKAKAWLEASPTRHKTADGMPRFFVNWFNRAVNGSRGAHVSSAPLQRASNVPDAAATRKLLGS